MTLNSANAGPILPVEYGKLVSKPVEALSAAFLVGTQVNTSAHTYKVPILASDVPAGAVAEGAEITPGDAVFTELNVTPAKFAGLSIVSREVADDSNPSASTEVGKSIARQIAHSVDHALFNVMSAPNPAGLAALSGISEVDAPAAFTDLDPFHEAISLSEAAGGNITAWVANPSTLLPLNQLKDAEGSARNLLNAAPTEAGRSTILGRAVFASSHVPDGVVYGISGEDLQIVVREGTRLDIDNSAYFSSDRVGVRGTMRVAFAVPVPATQVRITQAAE
ncbi:phage major capsid protein [Streptomyces sp. NE06-03E]|uniref:phage major capsid protein n=1 Tax=Streptomyces sp. NE06-03E TaxID=3028695 RepID=UPI0029AF25BE|nr:phage major capsid protein [Streptomyces sp. NE06-03E]MDX3056669.1 phage major capsid protein [Streptomyces sp. NE06-03E]